MDVSFLTARQHDLRLPKAVKEKALATLVAHQPTGPQRAIDDAPFRRMYDFWFASIVWAEHADLPKADSSNSEMFIKAGPTDADARLSPAMLEILLLIAVRRLSPDVNSLPDPAAVFKLANELAAAGAPRLIEEISRRSDLMEPPLYVVTRMFQEEAGARS
jgi:hypothetical protein